MNKPWYRIVGLSAAVVLVAGLVVFAWNSGGPDEQERVVKESEVPASALAALKKLAGTAKITEFEEAIEHGHTFYECSWDGPHGKVEVQVTPSGDLVETEETVPAGMVPKAVLAEAKRAAGKDAKLYCEKKTMILYEVKFSKGDRRHEMLFSPDGRVHEQEEEGGHAEDD
ncbi:MAG: hypothetical protein JXQ75_23785 [Phycisphaerae bacterium]|nr:hypothetical protein [Phycisphaerae bacterium]